MATDFTIKRADRRPRFRVQLTVGKDNPVPINLTGNTGVWFIMKNGSGTITVNQPATVVDAANGIVEYAWGATDTTTLGDYSAEFEVAWSASRTETQTFPSEGYWPVHIVADLA